jgi:quercetin dioxygenase-like cupin family protein
VSSALLAVSFAWALAAVGDRAPVKCMENSPERRGEEGCTILASRPLAGTRAEPLFWHIDRFDSLAAAEKAAGPDGVAAEAHGSTWLMTVEARTDAHHGGHHVASIGPLTLANAERHTMRVMSTLLAPGSTTPVHTHPGPEVFYIVEGEQCLETPQVGHHVRAGESLVLGPGVVMRGRITGSRSRRAVALVLHDAAHPGSHDLVDPPPLTPCR